jgi:MerR family transcriptional regulator/heat shock protein HspR
MDSTWLFPTPKTAPRITDDRARALYVISIAAELSGVHPQTLRMYERKGLLEPARTEGRARRYSESDIERVRMIQWLTQQQGVNLAGVEMLIAMNERMLEMQRALDEAQARIERLKRKDS